MKDRKTHAAAVGLLAFLWSVPVAAGGQDAGEAHSHNVVTVVPGTPEVESGKMIFGQLVEHFGNQVYGGTYAPGSKFADEDGFRTRRREQRPGG